MAGMKPQQVVTNGSRQWLASSVLSSVVLEPLYELNRQWLALLALVPRLWTGGTCSRLPDPVSASLVVLAPDRRTEIAHCPFSLFTARFNDGVYWLGIAGNTAVQEPRPGDEDEAVRGAVMRFSEIALFYAWHLARTNPPAARIILGFADQTLSAFQALTLTSLQRLAGSNHQLFAPRWPERTVFWLRLLDSLPDNASLIDVRLLGLQMLAAELPSDQPRDLSARRTTKP